MGSPEWCPSPWELPPDPEGEREEEEAADSLSDLEDEEHPWSLGGDTRPLQCSVEERGTWGEMRGGWGGAERMAERRPPGGAGGRGAELLLGPAEEGPESVRARARKAG